MRRYTVVGEVGVCVCACVRACVRACVCVCVCVSGAGGVETSSWFCVTLTVFFTPKLRSLVFTLFWHYIMRFLVHATLPPNSMFEVQTSVSSVMTFDIQNSLPPSLKLRLLLIIKLLWHQIVLRDVPNHGVRQTHFPLNRDVWCSHFSIAKQWYLASHETELTASVLKEYQTHKRFNRTVQSRMQRFSENPLFQGTNITFHKQTLK